MERFEAIVLGTGGVGSAAFYQLASRGVKVLGLDRFPPAHDRGSSHGDTRVIRLAYFEGPDYVPLLRRSYALWEELDALSSERLYEEVGLLQVGPEEGTVIAGVRRSAEEHGLDVETLDGAALADRLPGFRVPDGHAAVFERRAGFLRVEDCIRAYLEQAQRRGGELRVEAVTGWRAEGDGVVVTTDAGVYGADRLVIAAGAWASRLLPELSLPLRVVRKPLFWFETEAPHYTPQAGCPVFLYEIPAGVFYGFPQVDGHGLKVAEHTGREDDVPDPLALERAVDPAEEARVLAFVGEFLPGVGRTRTRHAACMYTLTPDDHFVVDVHPRHPQVCFAAGLCGHGFKMASALGEILADLAWGGEVSLPIGFLSRARFDPG